MNDGCVSYLAKLWRDPLRFAEEFKIPLIAGFVCGFAAHMSAFTNKYINADELEYLFSKGATLASGRWALALTSALFPDVSMPWVYGVLTLALLTLAACFVVAAFGIKSGLFQFVLTGLIVAQPVETLTVAYTFTSASYALAVLLIALSIYIYIYNTDAQRRKAPLRLALSAVSLCFALGIYQAYISLAVGLFLTCAIKTALALECDWKRVLATGLGAIGVIIAALVMYFFVNKLVMCFSHVEYNSYAAGAIRPNISFGIQAAYAMFKDSVNNGFMSFVPSGVSRFAFKLLFVCTAIECALLLLRGGSAIKFLFAGVMVYIFPLAVNCLLVASPIPHPVEYFSFVCVYVLAAVVADSFSAARLRVGGEVAAVLLAVVLLDGIYFSNTVYLKQKLNYEQAYGFYSGVVAKIKCLPEYACGDIIVLAGNASDGFTTPEELEVNNDELPGIRDEMINVYSRDKLIKYYLGFDAQIIDLAEVDERVPVSELYERMNVYPAAGSVEKIENYIVVKLS